MIWKLINEPCKAPTAAVWMLCAAPVMSTALISHNAILRSRTAHELSHPALGIDGLVSRF